MRLFIKFFTVSFAAFLILGTLSFTSPKYSPSLNNTKGFETMEAVCYEGTNSEGVYLYAILNFKNDGSFTGAIAASDGSSVEISGSTDGDKIYLDNGGEWALYDGYAMTGNGIQMNQVVCD